MIRFLIRRTIFGVVAAGLIGGISFGVTKLQRFGDSSGPLTNV